jgi:hypothetical protein
LRPDFVGRQSQFKRFSLCPQHFGPKLIDGRAAAFEMVAALRERLQFLGQVGFRFASIVADPPPFDIALFLPCLAVGRELLPTAIESGLAIGEECFGLFEIFLPALQSDQRHAKFAEKRRHLGRQPWAGMGLHDCFDRRGIVVRLRPLAGDKRSQQVERRRDLLVKMVGVGANLLGEMMLLFRVLSGDLR